MTLLLILKKFTSLFYTTNKNKMNTNDTNQYIKQLLNPSDNPIAKKGLIRAEEILGRKLTSYDLCDEKQWRSEVRYTVWSSQADVLWEELYIFHPKFLPHEIIKREEFVTFYFTCIAEGEPIEYLNELRNRIYKLFVSNPDLRIDIRMELQKKFMF